MRLEQAVGEEGGEAAGARSSRLPKGAYLPFWTIGSPGGF